MHAHLPVAAPGMRTVPSHVKSWRLIIWHTAQVTASPSPQPAIAGTSPAATPQTSPQPAGASPQPASPQPAGSSPAPASTPAQPSSSPSASTSPGPSQTAAPAAAPASSPGAQQSPAPAQASASSATTQQSPTPTPTPVPTPAGTVVLGVRPRPPAVLPSCDCASVDSVCLTSYCTQWRGTCVAWCRSLCHRDLLARALNSSSTHLRRFHTTSPAPACYLSAAVSSRGSAQRSCRPLGVATAASSQSTWAQWCVLHQSTSIG